MLKPHVGYHGRRQAAPDHVRSGEVEARFERDVIPLRNQLYSAAIRLTHNRQDAEDLVQDTILRAYAGFRTFNEGTNTVAWLHRIMRNTWINHWRKKQRSCPEVLADCMTDSHLLEYAELGRGSFCSAENVTLQREPDSDVKAALMELNENFRVTVYYADIEGLSIKEIARTMNVPSGTVISRLHRGRRRLRTSLLSAATQYGYSTSACMTTHCGVV